VLRWVVPILVLCAACSGSGKTHGSGSTKSACALVARLDETAAAVGRLDLTDPVAFNRDLRDAAAKYAATVAELRPLVPVDVQAGLDRLEADVNQLRFDDASTDRAALDAYAAEKCGRVATTTTPTT
jgi:hypothetical protein